MSLCKWTFHHVSAGSVEKKGSPFNRANHENKIFDFRNWNCFRFTIERLRNENEDKTKTHDWIDSEYFGAKSWSRFQNIDWMIAQFASSSCLHSHFVISLLSQLKRWSVKRLIWLIFGGDIKVWTKSLTFWKSVKIDQKQGINFGASWIKLIIHIASFIRFVMPFSLTACQKC